MPSSTPFPIGLLHSRLDSGQVLTEALLFPELSRLGADRSHAAEAISKNLETQIAELAPSELFQRRLVTQSTTRRVSIDLEPPREGPAWKSPVRLRFAVVVWEHGKEAVVARVPELGIEIIATKSEDLPRLVRSEIIACLRRTGDSASLQLLAWRQRLSKFRVDWATVPVELVSLRKRAEKEDAETQDKKESVLSQVATRMNGAHLSPAYELEEVIVQLAEAIRSERPQSTLLIGPNGVGKTAAIRELIRTAGERQLGSAPFYMTSGARIVAGQTGFGMWQERCTDLVREAGRRRAIVHLGNLVELMEVGKSEHNQIGIAGFLRPAIARGELICIAECTPEQVPMIEREGPQLLDAFRRIDVPEPDDQRGRRILERFVSDWRTSGRAISPAALDAVDRLHRRYATYSAFPGRPIRFLTNLRTHGQPTEQIAEGEVLREFGKETGLPRVLLDPSVRLDLEQTRQWFAERVVGQSEAVELVTDLLATIKAGLTRPNRPIASLLFVGPTGVGKTELAKALAEFLFGSRDRLTRFDMSEYGDPISVSRLAGTAFGTEGILTAKVREQPFSVILLDEVEKAHPAFFDLLLQALGEARLTDAGGRLADFRNAVIILTSNLGAESFQSGNVGFGTPLSAEKEAKNHFVREAEKFLRPEMFNRIDRLVPFAPLGAATIRRIAQREWDKVLSRDGAKFRGARVSAGEGVIDRLANRGLDVRYGARPLKRALERDLLAPMAHQMNRYPTETPLDVQIQTTEQGLMATVKPRPNIANTMVELGSVDGARQATRLRRMHQALQSSSTVRDLENEIFQLSETEKEVQRKQRRGLPLSSSETTRLAKLGVLREVHAEVVRQREAAFHLENESLVAVYDRQAIAPEVARQTNTALVEWDDLLIRLYRLSHPALADLTIGLFSESKSTLFALAAAYVQIAEGRGMNVEAVQFMIGKSVVPPGDLRPERPNSESEDVDRYWYRDFLVEARKGSPLQIILLREPLPDRFKRDDISASTIGVALRITGTEAELRFGREAGLHVFTINSPEDSSTDVLVEVDSGLFSDYIPPEKVERRGGIGGLPPHRHYLQEKRRIVDFVHNTAATWEGDLVPPLAEITALNVRMALLRLVTE